MLIEKSGDYVVVDRARYLIHMIGWLKEETFGHPEFCRGTEEIIDYHQEYIGSMKPINDDYMDKLMSDENVLHRRLDKLKMMKDAAYN